MKVLPGLIEFLPEARLNLVIHYLRTSQEEEAFALMKDIEPSTPQDYILKGVANASVGQQTGSREHLKIAQQFFQLVGGSASECDTIPGRQCMASCFFLLRQFDDVNSKFFIIFSLTLIIVYLNSIKAYRKLFNINTL